MRSANVDKFNHDADAADYDASVADESDPIRAGYDAVLGWVAEKVPAGSGVVIDLGCGTGNLALRIAGAARLLCVDVSDKMTAIARRKLAHLPCEFVQADLLECFDDLPLADVIVSTYAVHHLTWQEKQVLFQKIHGHLAAGGMAVFGDLMFESRTAERSLCNQYARSGRQELVDDLQDEFFWYVDEARAELQRIGFHTVHKQFSELSWGIAARKTHRG
ncbi:MAG: class I SAM-dependent methyltransferase [Proteobacteria bacterium]|nr:class I SAM-dependent methyltransferase [Pseudomonadota bacterium]